MKRIRYTIIDIIRGDSPTILRTFSKKAECYQWLLDGIRCCEGAERDHYVEMLLQLDDGRKTLVY